MERYFDKLFTASQVKKSTVKFANAPDQFGDNIDLYADIYQPDQNIDSDLFRKFILLIHGGGGRNGDKAEMMTKAKTWYARRGYVTAAINYRLDISVRDLEAQKKAALVATSDTQAAIRFFFSNNDTYNIDPEKIALFGSSFGCITAYMVGVMAEIVDNMDDLYQMPQPMNICNPGFPSNVQAVIGESGLIYPEYFSHIDPSDCPFYYDFHGDEDIIAPYATAESTQDHLMLSGLNAILDKYVGYGHLGFPQAEVESKSVQWLFDNF